MGKNFRLIFKYLKYFGKAKTKHGLHSPFVYKLMTEVLEDKYNYEAYRSVERVRQELLKDTRTIRVTELGAGSQVMQGNERRIADIARTSAKPKKYGQLLYRLAARFHPDHLLEMGTSLGLSTHYLACARPHAQIITLEGCPEVAREADRLFQREQLNNIELIVGDFKDTLPLALQKMPRLDFVFFDGNHRKEPTLEYFRQCLAHAHEDTVFIFDDIHWTEEMEEAWEIIRSHERVTISLDLFFIGIVFFRSGRVKEHFTLFH